MPTMNLLTIEEQNLSEQLAYTSLEKSARPPVRKWECVPCTPDVVAFLKADPGLKAAQSEWVRLLYEAYKEGIIHIELSLDPDTDVEHLVLVVRSYLPGREARACSDDIVDGDLPQIVLDRFGEVTIVVSSVV